MNTRLTLFLLVLVVLVLANLIGEYVLFQRMEPVHSTVMQITPTATVEPVASVSASPVVTTKALAPVKTTAPVAK